MPSARPIFTSISLISLSDLRPKFLVFSISFFALLDELADGLDIGVLQAVVGAHGKLELLDGAVEMFEARIVGGVHRGFEVSTGSSKLMKMLMWSLTSLAARPMESCG